MHYKTVKVEGFDLQKFLTQCIKENISIYHIQQKGSMEIILQVSASDWTNFLRTAGNRYRITVLSENGIAPLLKRVFSKKSMVVGIIFFIFLVYWQSCFISEIRIYGYESLSEREIRESLAAAGLYEGCSKKLDPDGVEIQMFRSHPELCFIGIKYIGNLAEVNLVEGSFLDPDMDNVDIPRNIVAKKDGYVEKIIARQGSKEAEEGQFVRKGDILISGLMPIEDKTYKRDPEGTGSLFRYVHAEGEVYAKIIYRFIAYQQKHEIIKKLSGRSMPGIAFTIGGFSLDTTDIISPYDTAICEQKVLINQIRPIPIRLCINRQNEVSLVKKERDEKDIERLANQQARAAIRENIPEFIEIINKSLKFYPEENIIKIVIMVETLEEIGTAGAFEIPKEGI